ncbi:PREDICTED: ATP-binding cassette sub-family G member 1-like isoform X2 [Vollenhovia emeryi]|uniref:ATP-binding cassette sub-family G member 1-like isoform X2 n=1 Tax=Vollenhovia emeryi TaxID=411798 RepID=UPI0005F408D3|nr:PREDICTED: ATP-binding cassette sub-family G member 1-like isoform X2 [Vollenhovia emeryi]
MDPTSENNVNGVGNGIHKSMKDTLDNGNGTMSHLSRMAAVDIEFNDVTYSVKTGPKEFKMLLKGVSGQFKSGELTVILGPSGAGKSTLLNVLAGYRCMDIGGSIRINGQLRDVQKFKKMSRYIMQDNMTQPNLTVFEAMSFAADFKLGKRKSRLQKRAAINEILSILRLTGTQNTVTDKLSGGEKKRLTIALELVNNPPVIFLDEPTCGLDNLSSTKCVDILKRLAHLGRTVVCSMHTPSASAFNKFDHVYILTNGQCVYRDTASNVVPFMRDVGLECPKHYSPADFIIEMASDEHDFDLIERMVACVNTNLPLVPILQSKSEIDFDKNNPKISWIYQFNTSVRRMMTQLYRNRNYMYVKLWVLIFLGIVNGSLFWNIGNDASRALFNFGFCFGCQIYFLYIPLQPVLLTFPSEVKLMAREHFNGWYNLSAYYWALTVVSIPLQIIFGFCYLTIIYLITGQPLELHRSSIFFGTCFVCAFISESIGQNIGSMFNPVNSMVIGSIISCPLILTAIQDFGVETTGPRPLFRTIFMYTSHLRYGLEGLTTAIYGYGRQRIPCPTEEFYCHFSSPKEIMQIIGITYYFLRQRVQPNKTFQMFQVIRNLFKNHFNI